MLVVAALSLQGNFSVLASFVLTGVNGCRTILIGF